MSDIDQLDYLAVVGLPIFSPTEFIYEDRFGVGRHRTEVFK